MEVIHNLFKNVGNLYNGSSPHFNACIALVEAAHNKLNMFSDYGYYGYFHGRPFVSYNVFTNKKYISRPVRPDIYIDNIDKLLNKLTLSREVLNRGGKDLSIDELYTINSTVYTLVLSVACCYDLWKPDSRKTPGTFFEFFMAALLQGMLPEAVFSRHIPLAVLLNDAEASEGVPQEMDASVEDEERGGPPAFPLISSSACVAKRGD